MRIPYLCINEYSQGTGHEGTGELGTRGAHTGRQTADDVECSDHLKQTHKNGTLRVGRNLAQKSTLMG